MQSYATKGTCSRNIQFEVTDGIVTACRFEGGCGGNLQGLARLVVGRPVDDVIAVLEGIQCQNGTSCPDQLAKALKVHVAQQR